MTHACLRLGCPCDCVPLHCRSPARGGLLLVLRANVLRCGGWWWHCVQIHVFLHPRMCAALNTHAHEVELYTLRKHQP